LVGGAGGDSGVDFQGDFYVGAYEGGQVLDDLFGDSAGVSA